MFAVPGWALPSGPAEQTDPSAAMKKKKKKTKRGKTKDVATGSNSVDVAPEPEKKEKETAAPTAVTADNVEALWRKVIVGESGGKKRKRGSSGGKKRGAAAAKADDGEEAPGKEKEEMEEEGEGEGPLRKKTSKEKRREKKAAAAGVVVDVAPTAAAHPGAADTAKLTPLQQKMRAKLTSARFRHINETLYTTASTASLSLFAAQPEMYGEYHQGFRQQVAVWPSNPVDAFVGALRERAGLKFQKGYSRALHATAVQPLPRDRDSGVCTVADLGCGDAKIAATFNHGGGGARANIRVLSFDLQASTPDVTIADIASLPLGKESVDVAIFCLALMGTNFLDFVDEAYRVLRWRGELWVAEIKSRFHRNKADSDGDGGGGGGDSNSVGRRKADDDDGEPDMEGGEKRGVPPAYANFVEAFKQRGLALRGSVDDRNKMFVRMEFVKLPADAAGSKQDTLGRAAAAAGRRMPKKPKFIEAELKEDMIMKPCVYKLR